MTIQDALAYLEKCGVRVSDYRHLDMGFAFLSQPYSEQGAAIRWSKRRGVHITVSSMERDTNEVHALIQALERLSEMADLLNGAIKSDKP